MKDAIDHVLPWIKPDVVERELAAIVAKEVREPLSVVTHKLKAKGRYYGWNGFGASEIDLTPPLNRSGRQLPRSNIGEVMQRKREGAA